jgi:hypothetical protein
MIKLFDLLKEITESKQVGTVYHFTKVSNIKKILTSGLRFAENNEMGSSGTSVDSKKKYAISITRSPNFNGKNPYGYKNGGCRLVLDGDKIAQRYKIAPINIDNTWYGNNMRARGPQPLTGYFDSKFSNFFEERVYSPTQGYIPIEFIKQIDIVQKKWDKLSPEDIEMLDSLNRTKIPINIVKKF